MTDHPTYTGTSVPSQEGTALLRGTGQFTADVPLENPLVLHLLRSPVALGRVGALDISAALQVPGVHAVHIGADVAGLGTLPVNPVLEMARQPDFPILAQDCVLAIGQPVAAILAQNANAAADAAELIDIDYDDAPDRVWDPLAQKHWQAGDVAAVFAAAAHVVSVRVQHAILAPSPMETRGIAVQYHEGTDSVTLWQSTQTPHRTRAVLANILGISPDRIRVIAPDVGGAFGMKGSVYPEEVLAVWAALHHRRNLRWIATRSEDFLSASHGRGLTSAGQLALGADGRFLGLTAQIDAPLGYWLPNSGLIPAWNAARVLPGGYDIDVVDITTTARLTQRPPMGLYRGAGRPEANILMERLVEKAARVTGLDPFDLRRRNLRRQLPARTATGNMLDSGDYPALLEMLRDKGGWDAALARRDACRAQGRLAGVGMAFYVEPSGEGWESARVTSGVDGRAEVASGSSAQGQWRATAFAQIAADALGLCLGAITVRCGDTGTCPEGIGALASRSTPIGGSAVLAACRAVKARRDSGEAGEITEEIRYETDGQAWGYGAFLAELDVDGDTGAVTVSRMVSVDDTGVVINPALVRGQIIGGAAQGLGEALMERLVFDEDGQLLTGSFMDYALPRAADMPPVEVYSRQTASPLNLLGAKGVGEAGTIGAPAAILNAALDALGPVGVRDLTMPLTPSRVWAAIRNANQNEVT